MHQEIIFSGFGGQGALFAGQLLAYAALDSGLQVTWIPSYGPEMRGGTAYCTVIVSDEPIGSPVVRNPRAAIVMNLPSLEKYEPLVREGGLLIVNGSLVDRPVTRADLEVVTVRAEEVAQELGDKRMANVVLLGALLERLGALPLEQVEATLADVLPERRRALLEPNVAALRRGAAEARAGARQDAQAEQDRVEQEPELVAP